jgi:hypothetical protein
VFNFRQDPALCGRVVRDDHARYILQSLQQLSKEPLGCLRIASVVLQMPDRDARDDNRRRFQLTHHNEAGSLRLHVVTAGVLNALTEGGHVEPLA